MPSLQVKNVPNDLYDRLKEVAKMEHQTIDQALVMLLETGLKGAYKRSLKMASLFQEIDDLALENTDSFPAPGCLIREDRNR